MSVAYGSVFLLGRLFLLLIPISIMCVELLSILVRLIRAAHNIWCCGYLVLLGQDTRSPFRKTKIWFYASSSSLNITITKQLTLHEIFLVLGRRCLSRTRSRLGQRLTRFLTCFLQTIPQQGAEAGQLPSRTSSWRRQCC